MKKLLLVTVILFPAFYATNSIAQSRPGHGTEYGRAEKVIRKEENNRGGSRRFEREERKERRIRMERKRFAVNEGRMGPRERRHEYQEHVLARRHWQRMAHNPYARH